MLYVTGDDWLPNVYVNDVKLPISESTGWSTVDSATWSGETYVIAIECVDTFLDGGVLASTNIGVMTDSTWKCSNQFVDNW